MFARFREWRQNRKTDKLLARIRCLSGDHEMHSGGDVLSAYCKHCGHDMLDNLIVKRLLERKQMR